MNLDVLRLIRNFLLRLFVISIVLTLVAVFATVALWDTWTGLTSQWFHVTPAELGPMAGNFFALVKFYYLFVVLAPALALHWTIKAAEKST